VDDVACSSIPRQTTPSARMTNLRISFQFPIAFSVRVRSAERYWVTSAKHRSLTMVNDLDRSRVLFVPSTARLKAWMSSGLR
jgi:hypothetical protein